MSYRALHWVHTVKGLTAYQKVVLFTLAGCHNSESDACHPTMEFISRRSGVSLSKVKYTLLELEKMGMIASGRRTGRANKYKLLIPEDGLQHGYQPEQPEELIATTWLSDSHSVAGDSHDMAIRWPHGGPQSVTNQESNQESNLEESRARERAASETKNGTESKQKKETNPKRKSRVDSSFRPSDVGIEWASVKFPGLDSDDETDKFIDYHSAKGTLFADKEAAWRNWMRNAAKFQQRDSGRVVSRGRQADLEERNERIARDILASFDRPADP
jgi:hypothetical protein